MGMMMVSCGSVCKNRIVCNFLAGILHFGFATCHDGVEPSVDEMQELLYQTYFITRISSAPVSSQLTTLLSTPT
jgi:hypothetical protein